MSRNLELVNAAIAAHGGAEAWGRVNHLSFDVAVGGPLLLARMRSPLTRHFRVNVDPKRPHATLENFPRAGMVATFDGFSAFIQSGAETVARRHYRHYEDGRVRTHLRWDDTDEAFFFGQALWNYTMAPFYLRDPGFDVEEIPPLRLRGDIWRRLRVMIPVTIPAHSREQTFYFDTANVLRRIDYTAEMFGDWADASQLCYAHRNVEGILIPTHRVVHPRPTSRPFKPIRAIEARISNVIVSSL